MIRLTTKTLKTLTLMWALYGCAVGKNSNHLSPIDLKPKAGKSLQAEDESSQKEILFTNHRKNIPAEKTAPDATICQKKHGEAKQLTSGEQTVAFCQIGRALISMETLEKHLERQTPQDAVTLFLNRPHIAGKPPRKLSLLAMGNPSRLYCMRTGGRPLEMRANFGSVGICKWKDGSMMTAWTIFQGPTIAVKLHETLGDLDSTNVDPENLLQGNTRQASFTPGAFKVESAGSREPIESHQSADRP